MAIDEAKLGSMLANLSKEMGRMSDEIGKVAGATRTRRSSSQVTNDQYDKNIEKQKKKYSKNLTSLNDVFEDLLKETRIAGKLTKKHEQLLKDANETIDGYNDAVGAMSDEMNLLRRKGIHHQHDHLQRYSRAVKSATSTLGKQVKANSLFAAAMTDALDNLEHGSNAFEEAMLELRDGAKELNDGFLKKFSAEIEDLTVTDIRKMRLTIGNVEAALADSLNKLGVRSLAAAASKGSAAGPAIAGAAAHFARAGYDVGVNVLNDDNSVNEDMVRHLSSDAGAADLQKLISNLNKITEQNAAFTTQHSNTIKNLNTVYGEHTYALKSDVRALGDFKGSLYYLSKEIAKKGSGAGLIKAVGDISKSMQEFNIAYLPRSFMATNVESIRLGLSFEDLSKFMQENKRTMGIYGDSFGKFQNQFRNQFLGFGYTFKQAAEIMGPAVDSAAAAFVNIKDPNNFAKFINETHNSFKQLAGVLNITEKEYQENLARMMKDGDVRDTMIGLDNVRTSQYARDIRQSQQAYYLRGLELQETQNLITAQRRASRANIVDKMRSAAKTGLLGQVSGALSGDESAELIKLSMLARPNQRQLDRLTELQGRASVGGERYAQQQADAGIGQGIAASVLLDRLGEGNVYADQGDAAKRMEAARRGGLQLTAAQAAEAARKAEPKAGAATKVLDTLNSVESFLGNNFVKALGAASAGLISLTLSSISAARGAAMLGRGGGLLATARGGIAGKAGGKAVAKGVGKSLLKKIPGIGLLAGLGLAGYAAMKGDWTGAGLEAASGIAGTIPGLGTAASIGLDAANAARTVSGSAEEVNTDEGNLSVEDTVSAGHLAEISASMAEAVHLLQMLADAKSGPPTAISPARGPKQTAYGYVSGRSPG